MKKFLKDYINYVNWPYIFAVWAIYNGFIFLAGFNWVSFGCINFAIFLMTLLSYYDYTSKRKKKQLKEFTEEPKLEPKDMAEVISLWNWSEEYKEDNVKAVEAMFEAYGQQCREEA